MKNIKKSKTGLAKVLTGAFLTAALSSQAIAQDKIINFTYKTNGYSGPVNCDLIQQAKRNEPFPGEGTCQFFSEVDKITKGTVYTCPANRNGYDTDVLQGMFAHSRDAHGNGIYTSVNYDMNILRGAGYSEKDALKTLQGTVIKPKMEIYYLGVYKKRLEKAGMNDEQIHQALVAAKEKTGWKMSLDRLPDGTYRALYDAGEDARQQCLATYPELAQ